MNRTHGRQQRQRDTTNSTMTQQQQHPTQKQLIGSKRGPTLELRLPSASIMTTTTATAATPPTPRPSTPKKARTAPDAVDEKSAKTQQQQQQKQRQLDELKGNGRSVLVSNLTPTVDSKDLSRFLEYQLRLVSKRQSTSTADKSVGERAVVGVHHLPLSSKTILIVEFCHPYQARNCCRWLDGSRYSHRSIKIKLFADPPSKEQVSPKRMMAKAIPRKAAAISATGSSAAVKQIHPSHCGKKGSDEMVAPSTPKPADEQNTTTIANKYSSTSANKNATVAAFSPPKSSAKPRKSSTQKQKTEPKQQNKEQPQQHHELEEKMRLLREENESLRKELEDRDAKWNEKLETSQSEMQQQKEEECRQLQDTIVQLTRERETLQMSVEGMKLANMQTSDELNRARFRFDQLHTEFVTTKLRLVNEKDAHEGYKNLVEKQNEQNQALARSALEREVNQVRAETADEISQLKADHAIELYNYENLQKELAQAKASISDLLASKQKDEEEKQKQQEEEVRRQRQEEKKEEQEKRKQKDEQEAQKTLLSSSPSSSGRHSQTIKELEDRLYKSLETISVQAKMLSEERQSNRMLLERFETEWWKHYRQHRHVEQQEPGQKQPMVGDDNDENDQHRNISADAYARKSEASASSSSLPPPSPAVAPPVPVAVTSAGARRVSVSIQEQNIERQNQQQHRSSPKQEEEDGQKHQRKQKRRRCFWQEPEIIEIDD